MKNRVYALVCVVVCLFVQTGYAAQAQQRRRVKPHLFHRMLIVCSKLKPRATAPAQAPTADHAIHPAAATAHHFHLIPASSTPIVASQAIVKEQREVSESDTTKRLAIYCNGEPLDLKSPTPYGHTYEEVSSPQSCEE